MRNAARSEIALCLTAAATIVIVVILVSAALRGPEVFRELCDHGPEPTNAIDWNPCETPGE